MQRTATIQDLKMAVQHARKIDIEIDLRLHWHIPTY
jgi:hypothetical protein